MTVNILGTEYKLEITTEKQNPSLSGSDGYCDRWTKEIFVNGNMKNDELGYTENTKEVIAYTVRHKLIHALLWESGLRAYTEDEELVNWIAIQFPKMLATFKEVDAI